MNKNYNIIGKVVHGSEDSVDLDVAYVFDKLPEPSFCKEFCSSREENRNIVVVRDGIVSECYKGSPDETNNGIYRTYGLHKQDMENPIKREVSRSIYLKAVKSLRVILSHLSRSQYRESIKAALKGTWIDRIEALETVDFTNVDFATCNGKMPKADTVKVVAFQLGQTLALYHNKELYTKSELANEYKTLEPFLYRREDEYNFDTLNNFKYFFVGMLWKLDIRDAGNGNVVFCEYKKVNLKTEKTVE